MDQISNGSEKPGVSKLKLAVGAASLFLFIVGLKRTFSVEDAQDGARTGVDEGTGRPEKAGGTHRG